MKIFFTLLLCCIFFFSKSQNFNGQWKGSFTDNSVSILGWGGEKIDYVLELECNGSYVTGYSYTYFMDGGKRYYTICKLKGNLNKETKEVVVTEIERTKYNTPPEVRNCFQTHRLKYNQENSDTEALKGSWHPAPNQEGDCGFGKTTLVRRIVKRTINSKENKSAPPVVKIPPVTKNRNGTTKTASSNKSTKKQEPIAAKKDNSIKKIVPPKRDTLVKKETITPPLKKEVEVNVPNIKFEKRVNSVLKTLQIKNQTFTVDFYDNGTVDGDSISVFFNGKLVLSNKMLSAKPLKLTLSPDPDKEINELVMYAENLGDIPPNTALMIVNDGDKRYEVRITSDTQKNGTIRFSYNPNTP